MTELEVGEFRARIDGAFVDIWYAGDAFSFLVREDLDALRAVIDRAISHLDAVSK